MHSSKNWVKLLVLSGLLLGVGCKKSDIKIIDSERLFAYSEKVSFSSDKHFAVFSGPVRSEFKAAGSIAEGGLLLTRVGEKSDKDGSFSRYYSIYPYSDACSCHTEGTINLTLPYRFNFVKDDIDGRILFGMSSSLDDKKLKFNDICATLKLHLEGDELVRQIVVSGGNHELLGGPTELQVAKDGSTSLAISSFGSKTLTLDCGQGIDLAASESGCDFLLPIPPAIYPKGISVIITGDKEVVYEYELSDSMAVTSSSNPYFVIDDVFKAGSGHSLLSFYVTLPDGKRCNAVDLGGTNVTLCVPRGTDVTKLCPKFRHNGASIQIGKTVQSSGKSIVDFSSPVTYKVTSENGESSSYKISVLDIDIPAIYVSTPQHQGITSKTVWIDGSRFIVLDNSDWTYTDYGETSMKGRGNSSWSYSKKPYAVKFAVRPQKQVPAKETLLGMPGHKRWCLLSNCMGYHMTNQLGYEVTRRTTIPWSPHARYVELILNGVHKGLYSLVEQIRVDKLRLDIKEMDAEDITEKKITGGYLMNFDNTMDEPPYQFWTSQYKMPVMVKSPDSDEMVQAQFDYIQGYLNLMEASLKDDALFAKRDYLNYLDPDSFISAWMSKELASRKSKSTGTSTDFITPRSVFYYKDRGDVLKAGPCWDFDVHFMLHTEVLNCTKCQYYGRLFQDKEFVSRVKQLWPSFKSNLEGNAKFPTSITAYVDSLYNVCAYSAARDEAMWKGIWKSYPWYDAPTQRDRHIQNLSDRIAFMESEISKMQ